MMACNGFVENIQKTIGENNPHPPSINKKIPRTTQKTFTAFSGLAIIFFVEDRESEIGWALLIINYLLRACGSICNDKNRDRSEVYSRSIISLCKKIFPGQD